MMKHVAAAPWNELPQPQPLVQIKSDIKREDADTDFAIKAELDDDEVEQSIAAQSESHLLTASGPNIYVKPEPDVVVKPEPDVAIKPEDQSLGHADISGTYYIKPEPGNERRVTGRTISNSWATALERRGYTRCFSSG